MKNHEFVGIVLNEINLFNMNWIHTCHIRKAISRMCNIHIQGRQMQLDGKIFDMENNGSNFSLQLCGPLISTFGSRQLKSSHALLLPI